MGGSMTYDAKSYALAMHFLEDAPIPDDHEARCHELAQAIQRLIEDWIEANPATMNPDPHSGRKWAEQAIKRLKQTV